MPPKAPSLIDEIVALVPPQQGREKPWQDKVPPEVRAELEELKAKFRSGEIKGTKTGMAKAISETLARRNIYTIGTQGVVKWLAS